MSYEQKKDKTCGCCSDCDSPEGVMTEERPKQDKVFESAASCCCGCH